MTCIQNLLGWQPLTQEMVDKWHKEKRVFRIYGKGDIFTYGWGRYWYYNWDLRKWRQHSINLAVPDPLWVKPDVDDADIYKSPFSEDDNEAPGFCEKQKQTYKGLRKYI